MFEASNIKKIDKVKVIFSEGGWYYQEWDLNPALNITKSEKVKVIFKV